VTMTDEGFARAVIGLADSFARGNDAKLSGMLDAGANTQLSGLVDSGEWTEATQPIEAVRIVYAGSFDASMAMSGGGGGSLSGSMSTMIDQLKKALDAGAGVGALDVLEAQGVIPADQMAVMREQMEKFSSMSAEEVGEEMKKALATMGDGGDASGASGASGGMDAGAVAGMVPTRGVLLAIQDPRGAILLGWGALQSGEQWVFTNAPAADGDKPRAAAWDGIGPMGFMYSPMATGPAVQDGPTETGAAPGDAGSGGTDGGGTPSADPSGPTRKNTPSGPVTVPGGS